MNPRIASIENLIARDPGGRNVFGLLVADQLRLAAQSLRLARRVAIVSGFFIPEAGAGETDGPPGAKVVGHALQSIGIAVDYITDELNAPLFRALGIEPLVLSGKLHEAWPTDRGPSDLSAYLDRARPTHLLAIERLGRGADGRYRNARCVDVTATTAPLDGLFLDGTRRGMTTIGIGDGGNEIGMGKVFVDVLDTANMAMAAAHGRDTRTDFCAASTVATDFCIAAGVANWGAYGLAGAISVLVGKDLLPSPDEAARDIECLVKQGGAVDGLTHRRESTVDGLALADSLRMLENIRRQIAPSPLERGAPLTVGILGYREAGRAAAELLIKRGHQICISDRAPVTIDAGTRVVGVESGGHTGKFFEKCDLVVASPGVAADAPIRNALHRRGIPVMSELELAYQFCPHQVIAVTGTVGKRTTVELLQKLFDLAGRHVLIGGNRGRPLSRLLLDPEVTDPVVVAVSSFQLETVVHFRPHVAIMLNIDDAHLDRHRTVAEYVRIKSRIFMNHHPDDVLILNFDDRRLRPLARKHHGRTLFVSSRQSVDRGAWLADGMLRMNLDGRIEETGPIKPPFPENLLSAVLALRFYGTSREQLTQALSQLDRVETGL